MYFLVDIPTCNRLGLQGAEALVFSCLAFLCRDKGYWQGSYSKLATYSLCGSRQSAMRACAHLVDCGVLSITDGRFTLSPSPSGGRVGLRAVQNGQSGVQNGQSGVQNGRSGEKESTKEKENNIKKECVNKGHTHGFLESDSFSSCPVTKIAAAEFGQQNGIPIEVVGKWWYHFDERGWQNNDGSKIRNWQSSLQKWFLHEKQMTLQLAGVPQKQVREVVRNSRNEEIRRAELQRQHEEREKAEQEGVSIPESLAAKFAKFAPKK